MHRMLQLCVCVGGGVAPKDCVYEAVNHRNLSHASRVKFVQRSGITVERAMQILIKSGPRVIIRA